MSRAPVFSTRRQLNQLAGILSKYARLPFSPSRIPGAVLEEMFAYVRGGEVLHTYDFVDVLKREKRCGWQMKSSFFKTPVTWKRAKLPDSVVLIAASKESASGAQGLGDAIIKFCNDHAARSLDKYNLDEIGYSRLIIFPSGQVLYFESVLCTRAAPQIFNPADFEWRWARQKKTVKKEQLPALHGFHRPTGVKWWAWHGAGENQFHFYGERTWWPPSTGHPHAVTFYLPTDDERIGVEKFLDMLARLDAST